MRKFASAVVATLGVAGVLLSAQMANADDVKGSIGLVPDSGKPGDSIQLIGKCSAPDFKAQPLVSGGAFTPSNVTLVDHSPGQAATTDVWGFPVVAKNAKPGKYTVSYMCGPYRQHMTFTVLPADVKKPTTTPKPAQVKVKPKGAANTGDGSAVA
ncbi:hypothetical protein ACFQ1S_37595 [Kibdelosporangium lantanae]|uniref:Uncharacterized protein n=1 Tax=Kibdelosporangium lantanae TaxID=1497396 RepID=A0ABW3MNW7_9PSEU